MEVVFAYIEPSLFIPLKKKEVDECKAFLLKYFPNAEIEIISAAGLQKLPDLFLRFYGNHEGFLFFISQGVTKEEIMKIVKKEITQEILNCSGGLN